jgi:predicted NAD/FAD-dependent oxidoreductase
MPSQSHIAVVGAGLAGAACATALHQAGFQVSLFDKSRGPAGRMSTRRGEGWQCDHGAQYFTARDPDFRAEVARWEAAGVAACWQPRLLRVDADGSRSMADANGGADGALQRFVGTPRMTAPVAWLCAPLALHTSVTVTALQRAGEGWRLESAETGLLAPHFDAVLLAVPAPQAAPLLRALAPAQAALASATTMQACWTLMLDYDAPLALDFDAAFVNHGPLRWLARDSSKPGRAGRESWLLHASAAWSDAHLELDAQQVGALLLAAFADLGGSAPARWSAHRWRYASTASQRTQVCSWDGALGLGLCGDWLNGGTVEAAWLSGQALARQLIADAPATLARAEAA